MLHHYSSQKEKNRFLERLEQLHLEGFGTAKSAKESETQEHQIGNSLDNGTKKSTFLLSKEEKERIQKEQEEAKERKVKAIGMLLDASKLNRVIMADIQENPEQYITLLKRRMFNPHKCNIANGTLIEELPHEIKIAVKSIMYSLECKPGNFALLYAVISNWIKDEDMTIMECDNIYQKFGFSCQVIEPSAAQKVLIGLYERIKSKNPSLLEQFSNKTPKQNIAPNKSFAKLFVEYWDYDWPHPSVAGNIFDMWKSMSLEEIVEKGREGIGPVKRPKIPWGTNERDHFIRSQYEYYEAPIIYSYLRIFNEILKLNVNQGVRRGMTKYDENGIATGFTLFIDEKDISDLPIDREKIRRWTIEEEIEYRKMEEEEKRRSEQFDRYLKEMYKNGILNGKKRYGKEER